MRIQHSKLSLPEKMKQAVASADSLYQAVCKCYPNRALFFLQLDEMYMELCMGTKNVYISFRKMVRKSWIRCFPKVKWTDDLEKLLDRYQRTCRKWVWLIVVSHKPLLSEDLKSMHAIIKMHASCMQGVKYSGSEMGTDQYEFQEWLIQTGGDSGNLLEMTHYLKESAYDVHLRNMIALYDKCAEKEKGAKSLQFVQEMLMWMGIIAMQEPADEDISATIPDKIKRLWSDIMDQDLNETETNAWIRDFLARSKKSKRIPFFLMNIPYDQIRDTASKSMAQFQFCVIYAISCTHEKCVDRQSIVKSAVELYYNSFGKTMQQQNITKPVEHIVDRYCVQEKHGEIDAALAYYFQQRYDFVEDCFERIRKLDEDCFSSLQSEIEIRKIRAAEDIERMYQAREDEAYGKLMETLSNPIHGNIIGQLYLLAAEKKEADSVGEIKHLLKNLFLLLQQKMIMPVWDENNSYPGWSVRGKIVVKPTNCKEEK